MFVYLRWLVAAVALAVVVTACSSRDFEPDPLDERAALVEDGSPTDRTDTSEQQQTNGDAAFSPTLETLAAPTLELSAEALGDGPLTAEQLTLVTAWFDEFLHTRDLYYVGRATRDDVAAYTIDRGLLGTTEQIQAEYIKLLEQDTIIAITDFASFSNPKEAVAARGQISFIDCTEQQRLSTIGIVSFRWVKQRVVLSEVEGAWTISQVEVLHDGEPWTTTYGCVPDTFAARAVGLAQQFMEENRGYQQDPDSLPDDGAFALVRDPLMRQIFVNAVLRQQEENVAVTSPEEFRFTVQGLDVASSLVDWVVAVDVCSFRPEGLVYTTNDTDQITQDPNAPRNFSLNYRLLVSLDPVQEGVVPADVIVAVDIGETGCW